MSRPTKYTGNVIKEIIKLIEEYVNKTEIPITAEFAWQNKIPKSTLYNLAGKHEELLDSIKRLSDKKEAQLERMALKGDLNTTMAIFSLKQIGWSDRQEHEITGKGGDPFKIEIEVVHAKK